MAKKVGIILINYKDYAAKYLEACRDSLRRQSYPSEATLIFIVDNASSVESRDFLSNLYPEAKIIPRPDGNYVAANNLGMKAAITAGCEYLIGANMDTEADPDWLSELVKALDDNPSAGVAQSKILLYDQNRGEKGRARINSLGNIRHFLGFGFTGGYGQPDREILGFPEIEGYASGCSIIFRREAFEKVGGYNEEFYMYHDDVEISLKIKLAGYKIILAPRSVIFHKYEFERSTRMIYYMERNRYLTMLIFYPRSFLFLIALPALFMDIGMFFFSLFNGWFKSELQIYRYFFRRDTYDKIETERRKITAITVSSPYCLLDGLVGRISFQEIMNPILRYIVNPLLAAYWFLIKKVIYGFVDHHC